MVFHQLFVKYRFRFCLSRPYLLENSAKNRFCKSKTKKKRKSTSWLGRSVFFIMEKVFVVFAQQRKRNFLTAQLFLQVVLQQKNTIRTEYPGRLRRHQCGKISWNKAQQGGKIGATGRNRAEQISWNSNQIIRRNRAEKYPGIIKKQF